MSLVSYELLCDDSFEPDLDQLLPYRVNAILAELANKYYRFNKPTMFRDIVTWINEYDGARIKVIYSFDDRSFEETIVDWLYNLRNYLVEH